MMSPFPIAAPTRADIANPMHTGTKNIISVMLNEIIIVAWFVSPKNPLIILRPWLHHYSKLLINSPDTAVRKN